MSDAALTPFGPDPAAGASGTWLRGFLTAERTAAIVAALDGAHFVDGKATAHGAAQDAKRNLQLPADDALCRSLSAELVAAASAHERFRTLALPRLIVPFTFARYEPGMRYDDHLDLPVMGTALGPLRTDLSMTVFLSAPHDYDGGELLVATGTGALALKGAPGDAFLYASGAPHRVQPVTRGRRLVAVTWIQSLVPDAQARGLLATLTDVHDALERAGAPAAELMRLLRVQHQLVRRWTR